LTVIKALCIVDLLPQLPHFFLATGDGDPAPSLLYSRMEKDDIVTRLMAITHQPPCPPAFDKTAPLPLASTGVKKEVCT
jgi:hypothetical protein